jgi:hypothetical protein
LYRGADQDVGVEERSRGVSAPAARRAR